MDSRIAAELLYESEATLRMVDTALDELRIGEGEGHASLARLETHVTSSNAVAGDYDFHVRTYWQVQEVAECVRDGREVLQAARADAGYADAGEDGSRLERVLSLLDRLEAPDSDTARDRSAILEALRGEIVAALDGGAAVGTERQIALAISLLAEAEGRLTRLGNTFGANG